MMLVRTFVAASPIEGLGVYADEFIPAGKLLWQLNPKFSVTFSLADIEAMPTHTREYVERYAFPHLTLGEGYMVLELDNGRYMNHSGEPNTDFTAFDRGRAIRDIQAGEEITCNYYEFDPSFEGVFTPPAYKVQKQNGLHLAQS